MKSLLALNIVLRKKKKDEYENCSTEINIVIKENLEHEEALLIARKEIEIEITRKKLIEVNKKIKVKIDKAESCKY